MSRSSVDFPEPDRPSSPDDLTFVQCELDAIQDQKLAAIRF